MAFQPNPGDRITINERTYLVGQHPAAPGLAYAQAGRQGIVYQLIPENGEVYEARALKVFFPKFRLPAMVYQSEHMSPYSEVPGLSVCSREVLTPEKNGDLIAAYPDLLYAVVMPWIHGVTWFDVISEQRSLNRSESLMLAKSLAAIGSKMEQRGLAHCDLSAPNVMLPFFSEVKLPNDRSAVELVDVEQMYSPKMDRPDMLLAGSPGYAAHRAVHSGLWSTYADRFAGAVIIAEMLGWSDPSIVGKGWGESYFDQHEMQTACERYFLLKKSLEKRWDATVAELFTRAWDSQDVRSCPTFGEWLIALSSLSPDEPAPEPSPDPAEEKVADSTAVAAPQPPVAEPEAIPDEVLAAMNLPAGTREVNDDVVERLFHQARDLEKEGNFSGALEIFRSAYHFVKKGSPLEVELAAAIRGLEEQLNPPANDQGKGLKAIVTSKKFMISSAAALVILAGSAFTVNQILAEKAISKQQLEEQRRLEEETRLQEEARLEEEARKKEEEARLAEEARKAEEARIAEEAKQAEEAELARKEQERAELQAKYDRQAKYEAYLAQVEEKKKRQELQEKYDRQAKYEAYLAQQEEKKKQQAEQEKAAQLAAAKAKEQAEAEARAKAEREAAAKAEAERKARAAAEQLKMKRDENVDELTDLYKRAYNAQVAGNKDRALNFIREFVKIYEEDAAYYRTVTMMRSRYNNGLKFIEDQSHWMPSL